MIRGLATLGSAALLSTACSVYDSSLKVHGAGGANGSGGSQSGGTSSGGEAGGTSASGGQSGATCMLKTYPPHPAGTNLGGDREIVAVQSNIDLGDSPPAAVEPSRYLTIGFDLDGLCSTTPELARTMTRCTLPKGSAGVVDGPQGQDDAMGYVIQKVRDFLPDRFSSDIYTMQLKNGAANAILHVTGYNGQADDDQVRLEALVSSNYFAYMGATDSGVAATPKWDGNDVWPVAADSVNNDDLSKPKNVDPNAYVSNHQLVATLDDSGFRLLIGLTNAYKVNLALHLHAAFLVCNVDATSVGRWGFTLNKCTLAGRWTADDLLHEIWRFPDPIDLQHPRPLCTDAPSYPSFKQYICSSQDVTSSGTAGPTAPCDAISFAANFDTVPALLGNVYNVDTYEPPCQANDDPGNDSCELEGGVPIVPGNGGSGGGGQAGAGGSGAGAGAGSSGAGGRGGSSGTGTGSHDASL